MHFPDEAFPPPVQCLIILDDVVVWALAEGEFVDLLIEPCVADEGQVSVVKVVAGSYSEEATSIGADTSESGLEVGGTGDASESADSEVVDGLSLVVRSARRKPNVSR